MNLINQSHHSLHDRQVNQLIANGADNDSASHAAGADQAGQGENHALQSAFDSRPTSNLIRIRLTQEASTRQPCITPSPSSLLPAHQNAAGLNPSSSTLDKTPGINAPAAMTRDEYEAARIIAKWRDKASQTSVALTRDEYEAATILARARNKAGQTGVTVRLQTKEANQPHSRRKVRLKDHPDLTATGKDVFRNLDKTFRNGINHMLRHVRKKPEQRERLMAILAECANSGYLRCVALTMQSETAVKDFIKNWPLREETLYYLREANLLKAVAYMQRCKGLPEWEAIRTLEHGCTVNGKLDAELVHKISYKYRANGMPNALQIETFKAAYLAMQNDASPTAVDRRGRKKVLDW